MTSQPLAAITVIIQEYYKIVFLEAQHNNYIYFLIQMICYTLGTGVLSLLFDMLTL